MSPIHIIDLDHIKDAKRVIQCSKSKDRQYIKKTNKQESTNEYTEN
jgi:hypothetical protein